MKILVVEDTEMHIVSAQETLHDHDLTIVSSLDEALDLLKVRIDHHKVQDLLVKEFGDFDFYTKDSDKRNAFDQERRRLNQEHRILPGFDAVLVDMMMPMSELLLAPNVWNPGKLVPYGFPLALLACQMGAKYVAMVTDLNHHVHPMSAVLDSLGYRHFPREAGTPNLEINGAKVMFTQAPFIQVKVGTEPCNECKETGKVIDHDKNERECYYCHGKKQNDVNEYRKDWGKVLSYLTGEFKSEVEE